MHTKKLVPFFCLAARLLQTDCVAVYCNIVIMDYVVVVWITVLFLCTIVC